jgi:hypothetical protein
VKPTTDALFWSMSAVDKFVLPYYQRTLGVERAAEMRKKLMASIRPARR